MAKATVKVVGTSFYYDGELHERGDSFDVDEEVAENFPRTLERQDDANEQKQTHDESGSSDGEATSQDFESMTHDELKELAEERGLAEEIDLRSKDKIVQALRE